MATAIMNTAASADQDNDDDLILTPLTTTGAAPVALWEVARISLASLVANKTRSLLTMLGVIIGVASVVALLALGGGASTYITDQITAIGTNVLTVQPGSPSSQGPGNSGSAETLTLDDANAIIALNLPVIGVAPSFVGNGQLIAPAADKNATIAGITPAYQVINNLTLTNGTFLDDGQVKGASPVIVLGSTIATDLFGSGQAVGQNVRIKDQPLRVIGVLAKKGSGGFGSVDDQAFVPVTLAQQRLFGGRTPDGNNWRVSSIGISVTKSSDMSAVQSRIEMLLRDRHHLGTDGSKDDFRVMNQASFLSTLTTITSLFTAFLAAVAGISLVVGGIGIMNIMLVSVTERTREIGLRKAVGARSGDILLQFMVEALVISLAGGLIGLALGAGLALGVTLTGLLKTPVTLSSMLLSVGFSLAVGLFFGIYPARRAAQLNPIDALRYE